MSEPATTMPNAMDYVISTLAVVVETELDGTPLRVNHPTVVIQSVGVTATRLGRLRRVARRRYGRGARRRGDRT